jgi:hypothetical protein
MMLKDRNSLKAGMSLADKSAREAGPVEFDTAF